VNFVPCFYELNRLQLQSIVL